MKYKAIPALILALQVLTRAKSYCTRLAANHCIRTGQRLPKLNSDLTK